MANLNLSEFTEKLFVADADHTFIWDSAASISKRVSRNSWLNSGTLTSDAPVTISQTWNAVGQTFTALKVNAAGTSDANSASGSLLADFQLGGTTKAKIDKLGIITANRIILDQSGSTYQLPANTPIFWTGASFLRSPSAGLFSFENNTQANFFVLAAEAPNTLALRNGAAAQTFRVYGAYPDTGINYARLALSCDTSGNATISTQALGTYTAGTVSINGVPVGLGKGNVASNIAIGDGALNANTTGIFNTVIGKSAGALLTGAGSEVNVIVGTQALAAATVNTTSCCVFGVNAFQNLTSAVRSVSVGQNAGSITSLGSNTLTATDSIFIGARTKALGTSSTNEIVIGESAIGIGSNSVVLGNDSITKTALKGNVGIGTTAPGAPLHVQAAAISGARETLLKATVSDNATDGFYIYNATTLDNIFVPTFSGSTFNSTAFTSLQFQGITNAANDIGTNPLIFFQSGTVPTAGDPTNQAVSAVTTRPSFAFRNGGTIQMQMAANGNLGIGTTSPTSKLHVAGDVTLPNGGSIFFGGGFNIYGTTTSTTINGPTAFGILNVASNGVTKWTFNYDGLLCGGGTTAAFPALKRSSTTMQARLADDTAFAPIQGKLTTDTAFTATTVTPTGFITLYDSTGAAYKVPCVPA